MANSYWNFATRMVAGTLAKAADVNTNLDGVAAGFALVETDIDAISYTVADEAADTATFVLFSADATGVLAPLSNSALTFNADTGALAATLLTGNLTGDVTGDVTGNADTVTTNANLTGDVTSVGNAATIAANKVTNAKAATMVQSTIKGRAASAGTGDPTDLTATEVRTLINVESGADVTDTTNVTSAGALMDSELTDISAIKTLSAPDNTTISAFGKTLVDDAAASNARTTLGVDVAGTVNYTHPNHSGHVSSSADGAQTLLVAAITGQTLQSTAIVGTDELLLSDAGTIKRSIFTRVYTYIAVQMVAAIHTWAARQTFNGGFDGILGGGTPAAATVTTLGVNGDVTTDADGTDSIGATAKRFLKGWFDSLTITGDVGAATVTTSGDITAGAAIVGSAGNEVDSGLFAIKGSDTSRDSGGTGDTLTDDPDLTVTLEANTKYALDMRLLVTTADSNPDFKFQFSAADGTHGLAGTSFGASAASVIGATETYQEVVPITGGVDQWLMGSGLVLTGGSGGTFVLQWAQQFVHATDTVLKAGSCIKLTKLT